MRSPVAHAQRRAAVTALASLLFGFSAWQANRDVCPGCASSDITFALADGTPIHARLYLPPQNGIDGLPRPPGGDRGEGSASSSDARVKRLPAVIVCHGYLANLAFVEIPWAADLTRLEFAALLLDRRGHGMSGGTLWPRDRSEKLDDWEPELAAAIGYLRDRSPLIDPARIGLLGHSDGATAALIAASADWDVRATVAVSASIAPLEFVNHVAPQNLLLVYGAEDRFVLGQTDRLLIARGTRGYLDGPGSRGEFGDGSARRLVRVPGRGHLDVFYSDEARLHILGWLRRSLEPDNPGLHARGSAAGPLAEPADVQLSPHRSVWLLSGTAAILLALLSPLSKAGTGAFGRGSGLVGTASGRGPNCRGETRRGLEFRHRNLAGLGRCIALAVLWATGLCLAPWLSQRIQIVPGQEGPVLAALLLGPAIGLWVGGAALLALNRVRAGPWRSGGVLSGGERHSDANTLSRALRGAARGALISSLSFAAARILLLHHYDIALSVPRLAILLVFSGAALPAFAALEFWLHRLAAKAWWYAPACEALLGAVTVILSGRLFERMSMAPGYLLAAALVAATAHRIGTRSLDPVASAVVGVLTIAWLGAVGAALY